MTYRAFMSLFWFAVIVAIWAIAKYRCRGQDNERPSTS